MKGMRQLLCLLLVVIGALAVALPAHATTGGRRGDCDYDHRANNTHTRFAPMAPTGAFGPAQGRSALRPQTFAQPRDDGVATEGGSAISEADLSAQQASNFSRYASKLPVKAETSTITQLSDGSIEFSARVPGEVPGSYAVYTKTVDAAGNTIGYVKTTIGPAGSVISVKDKFNP